MKWTRSAGNVSEYSTGYLGKLKYISMSHTIHSSHYWYTYSVNGEEILHGRFDANSWDEAEQIVVLKIRNELSHKANHWNELLCGFDKGMSENETVD